MSPQRDGVRCASTASGADRSALIMKSLMAIILVIAGSYWIAKATILQKAATTAAISDGMSFESKLKHWADSKVEQGDLSPEDVLELFPESYNLALSGENPDNTFSEMISDISQINAIPIWPGYLMVMMGISGLLLKKKNRAEQAP